MNIRKCIPNFITCCNLTAGCIASVMALKGNMPMATVWIVLAALFDFSDGLAARALHAYSPLGKELDSLADMISFSVAPGMMLFKLLELAAAGDTFGEIGRYIPYAAFVIPVFSGLRLAKFNIDDRQTTSFIGMPVPAHALFWASFCYSFVSILPVNSPFFVGGTLLLAIASSYLLVSELPMFSLKVKTLAWKGNELRYILVGATVLFICLFQVAGIAGAIVLYILLSFFNRNN